MMNVYKSEVMDMISKIKNKIYNGSGMTVLETLMSMFILLMVTAVVATGIPAAVQAYSKVLDSANAQLLISTAMTKLRDQLEVADEIVVSQERDDSGIPYGELTIITYKTNNYGKSRIYLDRESHAVRLWEYIEDLTNDARDAAITAKTNRLLVSRKASNDNLYLTYTSISSYNDASKTITFHGLVVKKDDTDQVLAGPLDYSIKLLKKY